MSHVDEGRLHAYLDGALAGGDAERAELESHLRVCGDCRVRLENARRVRGEAGQILGLLQPDDVAAPPFAEIVARRTARQGGGGVAGPRGGRRRGWVPLAWAASVVLAIGAGWLARASLAPAPGLAPVALETARTGARSGAPVGADMPAVELEIGTGSPDRRAGAAGEPEAAGRESEPGRARSEAAVPERIAAARAARSERPRVDAGGRADAQAAEPAAEPRAPAPAPAAAAAAAAEAGVAAAAEAEAEAEQADTSAARAVSRRLVSLADRATRAEAWAPVTPAVAARLLGGPPLDIEGVPWDRMEAADVEGTGLVRTVHPLPDGGSAELIQARLPGVGAAAADPLALRAHDSAARATPPARSLAPTPQRPRGPGAEDVAAEHGGPVVVLGAVERDGIAATLRGVGDAAALAGLLRRLR